MLEVRSCQYTNKKNGNRKASFIIFIPFICDSDRINYIDPDPCHGLVIKQKKWKPKASFRFHLFLFVTPTGFKPVTF